MALVTGSDQSHWQHPSLAYAQARKQAGDTFAIIKVSEGTARDPAGPEHHRNFGKVGIARGAYHFYRNTRDPIAQANEMIAAMASKPWELPPALDYENGSGPADADALLTFLQTLEHGCGRIPILYTGPAWWTSTINGDNRFARFPLWLAQYPAMYRDGTKVPSSVSIRAPHPWPTVAIWQFSDSSGRQDRNVTDAATLAHLTGDPAHNPEDDMTPAQEAKVDQLNAKLDEALPILRKLDADYLTKGKSVRQVLLHTDETVKDLRALLPKAKG